MKTPPLPESAGLGTLSSTMSRIDLHLSAAGPLQRRVIVAEGPDARSFLQGTLTADVSGWDGEQALPAALLTRKGQIVSELVLLAPPGRRHAVWILVPADAAREVLGQLSRYVVMDEVEIAEREGLGAAFVWDAAYPEGLASARGEGLAASPTVHPADGWLVAGPIEKLSQRLGAEPAAEPAAFEAHRIACGRPGWGTEIRPGRLPPEVGFAHAVSYEKGCYLGQEPLARLHARGRVPRVMVRVQAAGRPPSLPAQLAGGGREDAGRWTSFAAGPEGEGGPGLALVHRSVAMPGTHLSVQGRPELDVEVLSGPLGDDPGAAAGHKEKMKAARARLRGAGREGA